MNASLGGRDLKKRRPPEGGLSLGRKRPKEGICDVSHRSNIALHCSKGKRFFTWHVSYADGGELTAQPAENAGAGKKEAARRRPESREETPKEGMRGNRRTGSNVAPNVAKARAQTRLNSVRLMLRRFCNSEQNDGFVALQDF